MTVINFINNLSEKFYKLKPENIFLAISLFFGLLYCIIVPPVKNFDEAAHLLKVYSYSNFQIKKPEIPTGFIAFLKLHSQHYNREKTLVKVNQKEIYANFINKNSDEKIILPVNPADNYFFANYFPAIIVGMLTKNYPYIFSLLSRLSLLIVSTIIIYFTIKYSVVDKYILLFITLIPQALFVRSGVTADSLTFAYCFAYINLIILSLKPPSAKYFYSLIFLGSLVVLSKNIYFPLVLLSLFIPKSQTLKINNWQQKFVLISIPFLLCVTWNLICIKYLNWSASATYNSYSNLIVGIDWIDYEINEKSRIFYILNNPIHFIRTIYFSVSYDFIFLNHDFFGVWHRHSFNNMFFSFLYFLLILTLFRRCNTDEKPIISKKLKVFMALMFIGIVFLMYGLFYVMYTPLNYANIIGPQGRYFFPILLLVFLSFTSNYSNLNLQKVNLGGIMLIVFMSFEATYNIYRYYY